MLVLSSQQPRVVAGVRKQQQQPGSSAQPPRIAGPLTCLWDGEARHCEVRGGCLQVLGPGACPRRPELRLPLRRLHLRPHPAVPRAFTLGTDPDTPAVAFQAVSEADFSRWVRTLAVELLRQTPLDALRYLDVLAITAGATTTNTITTTTTSGAHPPRARSEDSRGWARYRPEPARDRSQTRPPACSGRLSRRDASAVTHGNGAAGNQRGSPPDSSEDDDEDREVAALLRRCQRPDGVATVGDKRRLFEALCRRRARSQDALARAALPSLAGAERGVSKRARSLHDLRGGPPATSAVRDMCRLFEQRVQQQQSAQPDPQRRRGHVSGGVSVSSNGGGVSALSCRRRVRRAERRLSRLQELSAAAEEQVWRLQGDMADVDRRRHCATPAHRTNSLYAALEQRLCMEETRLTRLQLESQRALKEVEAATAQLEAALHGPAERHPAGLPPAS